MSGHGLGGIAFALLLVVALVLLAWRAGSRDHAAEIEDQNKGAADAARGADDWLGECYARGLQVDFASGGCGGPL